MKLWSWSPWMKVKHPSTSQTSTLKMMWTATPQTVTSNTITTHETNAWSELKRQISTTSNSTASYRKNVWCGLIIIETTTSNTKMHSHFENSLKFMHEDVSSVMKSAETPRITAENHDVFSCSEYSRKRSGLYERTRLLTSKEWRCCLKTVKNEEWRGDSKGSITVIDHELSHRRTARGVAIVVVHRDRELLASASRSNRKLSAETWENSYFHRLH